MKPILFNTEMVRAILDSRKSCTRRLLKIPRYVELEEDGTYTLYTDGTAYAKQSMEEITDYLKSPYQVGDILYVRETFCPNYFDECIARLRNGNRNAYKADYNKDIVGDVVPEPKWRPSIHMPKEAARIFLKVTDVKVERLQDITEEQAKAEGFSTKEEFITTFMKIYPETDEKTYVWVIEFERCEKPEATHED